MVRAAREADERDGGACRNRGTDPDAAAQHGRGGCEDSQAAHEGETPWCAFASAFAYIDLALSKSELCLGLSDVDEDRLKVVYSD